MTAVSPRCVAVVLAAGEGTRMRSRRPKVLHDVAGRSMLAHVLASAVEAGATDLAVIVGPGRDDVASVARATDPSCSIFTQTERRGTAHAVLAARALLETGYDDLLVLYGDVPLITPATLIALRASLAGGAGVAVLGFEAVDPTGYGRLITDDGVLSGIREHKDATDDERQITLCNSGLLAIDGRRALGWLDEIGSDNQQGEFYLTDIVEVARRHGGDCVVIEADADEVLGVNDRAQLAAAEGALQRRLRTDALRVGATLQAPETVFLSYDTKLGRDVTIEPHVVVGPGTVIGDDAVIHAFSHLEGARVEAGAHVGPFARLRPGTVLGEKSKVGNFVEVKAAEIGPDAKVSHLSYIGDAEVGARANIGAGTITCNYDGFGKYRTVIGADAFVGSNSSLVAPLSIGAGAFVGSGSVVTEDVPADALALARGRQANKIGWAARFRAARKKPVV